MTDVILFSIIVPILCIFYALTFTIDWLYYPIHNTKEWKIYHDIVRYKDKLQLKEKNTYPNGDSVFTIIIKDIQLYKNLKIHYTFETKDIFIVGGSDKMLHVPQYFINKMSKVFDKLLFELYHY